RAPQGRNRGRPRSAPGDPPRRAGPDVGEKSVVEEQRLGQSRVRAEHRHQAASAREPVRRIVVEAAGDFHGDLGHAVDVRGLDVELAAAPRDVEVDHRGHVRASLAVGPERLAHRVDGDPRRDGRPKRGFVDQLHRGFRLPADGITATAPISTRSRSPGSPDTSTVVRAGRCAPNARAYTSFIFGNSFMSTRNTPQRTTCCRLDPAASRIVAMFLRTCSVCASTPGASRPVPGSRPAWPETNTRLPTMTPGEYGPTGEGRLRLVTGCTLSDMPEP